MRVSSTPLPSPPQVIGSHDVIKTQIVCFFFLLLVFKNYKINITKSSSDHMTTVQSTSAFVDSLVCHYIAITFAQT